MLWHLRHRIRWLSCDKQLPSISASSETTMQESPTRQSCGFIDKDNSTSCVAVLQVSVAEWQWPPPWHHQDSEPSSQLSDGKARTRSNLKQKQGLQWLISRPNRWLTNPVVMHYHYFQKKPSDKCIKIAYSDFFESDKTGWLWLPTLFPFISTEMSMRTIYTRLVLVSLKLKSKSEVTSTFISAVSHLN